MIRTPAIDAHASWCDDRSPLIKDQRLRFAQGLTASSLQHCLSRLDVRREQALTALMSCASTAYSAAPDTSAPSSALAAEAACSAALARLKDAGLATDATTAQIATLASEHAAVAAELQQTLTSAAEVGVIASLQERLQEYDAFVTQGRFSAAAAIALELERAAAAVPGAEDTAVQLTERVRVLREHLATVPPQYLVFDPTSHIPALYPPQDQTAAALADIWKAAQDLSVLPDALRALGSAIVEQSIKPVLAAEAAQAAAEAAGGIVESPAGSVASSALSAATTARGAARAGVERAIYKALKAVCDGALSGNPDLAASLGETFWPEAAGAYIAAKLRPLRPESDADLDTFVRAGALAVKLEQKAVKLGLWPADSEGPLAKYVRQAVSKVLADKRSRYTAAARDLLVSQASKETTTVSSALPAPGVIPVAQRALFDAQPGGGIAAAAASELENEPPVGDVGPYVVSRAAEGLVARMHEALSEACRSGSSALAQAMCGAVVDMSALLVAIGDPSASQQERLLPYIAALRYNDCMHVYRALCMLPQAHAPRLQALVHRAVNFSAPAQRVREAADAALSAMIRHQQGELTVVADQLTHWRGSADAQETIRCRKAVQQLLSAFNRFGAGLRGVLPRGAFIAAAAELMNAVCSTICEAILEMEDISEDESKQIPALLEDLTAPSAGIIGAVSVGLGAPSPSYSQGQTLGSEGLYEDVAAAAKEVARLREVCELLDVPSKEIARRWMSGRLQAMGLRKEQVAGLLEALFQDSEYRRRALRVIMGA